MSNEIEKYNALQTEKSQNICNRLMNVINSSLTNAQSKLWYGSPVWFIDGNPIVGYSKIKSGIQLLFWSGASFEEDLTLVGKHKAAEVRYTDEVEINIDDLTRWLNKAKEIQWDYKNIVKQQGVLERLK